MPECESCGASVDTGERECPFCGHSSMDRATAPVPRTRDDRAYGVDREKGTILFGDGVTGTRLPTGKDNVTAAYREGAGSSGNLVCSNCKHKNLELRNNCEACGAPLRTSVSRLS